MIPPFKQQEPFEKWIRQGESLLIEELFEAPKAYLIALCQQALGKRILVITSGAHEDPLYQDLCTFLPTAPLELPAWEAPPTEDLAPSPDIVGERLEVLSKLEPTSILLSSLPALLQKLLPPKKLQAYHLSFKVGDTLSFDTLPHKLSEMGYQRQGVAADKGEFAVRGGIIDLFPVASPSPFRVEFFGDEIESIRKYDPISQKSVAKENAFTLTPAEELKLLQGEEHLVSLLDYVGPDTLVILDDLAALEDKFVSFKKGLSPWSWPFATIFEKLSTFQLLFFTKERLDELTTIHPLEKSAHNPYSQSAPPQKIGFEFFGKTLTSHRWQHPFLPLRQALCPPHLPLQDLSADDMLATLKKSEVTTTFLCDTPSAAKALKEHPLPDKSVVKEGYLSSGFYISDPPFALVPNSELTGKSRVRRQKQRDAYHSLPLEMFSLTPGEAVVHSQNGVGKFLGIEKRPNHLGVETEFLLLEYAQGAKLYVPMHQSHLVGKYIGSTDEKPSLHTLGSNKWQKTKERTEKAIVGYAKDLLKLQAERATKPGFQYAPHSDLTVQFGKEFPYIETPDQLLAIESIHQDMLSDKSMDRLVCGDVGYGKTEVAMRAAFKAVVDGGKQVAVLVPTTLLAMQHFETFRDRMLNYPVKVRLLSRFQKPKEVKAILEELQKGVCDIVVGTHRLVSKDVLFKDLGLVIIDEEQRFGVKAKEHLKAMRTEVDCLTLSATPIPRTLYFSLVGARDMSVIATPPEDRLPIQSVIAQKSDELIKNALTRELARDGQAYVVHNRVETLYELADKIRQLVPGARVIVGHGQMAAKELDTVFHTFKEGRADILVATTIIENGVDIPKANTILIDRANHFGMADLYQIRGRVGRWNKKAYCYFLVNNSRTLSSDARRRLTALAQSSGHGGGMKIAMHDLEIRGAGNILGTEQSGHISAIGFQLYCKLLKKTIKRMQRKGPPLTATEVKIEIPFDARFPETYVNEPHLRLDLYSRLGDAEEEKEIDEIFNEVKDRFGPPPLETQWLQALAKIRLFASLNQLTLLKFTNYLFEAHQTHGPKNTVKRKILFSPPKDPAAFEQNVKNSLKSNFPLIFS